MSDGEEAVRRLIVWFGEGRYAEVEAAARAWTELAPDEGFGWKALGMALQRQGRDEEALEPLARAAERLPGDVETLFALGAVRRTLGEESEAIWRAVLRLSPGHAGALINLGALAQGRGRLDEAEALLREAIRCHPGFAVAYHNLGLVLRLRDALPQAEAALREAVRLDPELTAAWHELSVVLYGQGRGAQAEGLLREVLRRAPGSVDAAWQLGWRLLKTGRYAEAWPLYELRCHPSRPDRPVLPVALPFPRWAGEEVRGKAVLMVSEQGYGDTIQFCRYAALLREAGAVRLTLVTFPALVPLLEPALAREQVMVATDLLEVPPHDYWTFILDLPGRFGTTLETIPARIPYLATLPERDRRWSAVLPDDGRVRVGVAWRGSALHGDDRNRSLPGLEALAPLWQVPGIAFFALQKGEGEAESLASPPGQPLVALGGGIGDFADSASIVARLDLVITVDTALAHLCGALGRPCWVLLPRVSDWRWLEGREDSPWYPGVLRLFHQPVPGDWPGVVEEAARALFDFLLAIRFGQGALGEVESLARRLVAWQPGHAFGWKALGVVLQVMGRLAEAREPLRIALEKLPGDREVLRALGVVCEGLGRPDEAEVWYRRLVALWPDGAQGHNHLGTLFLGLQRLEEAEAALREAVRVQPGFAAAWTNLGLVLAARGGVGAAEAAHLQALRLQPGMADAHYNLANLYREARYFDEALAAYREALRVRPGWALACNNLGSLLHDWHRDAEAESVLREALRLEPDFYAEAAWNLSLVLLRGGRFAEGWPWYEARHHERMPGRKVIPPVLPFPMWRGEEVAGRSFLVIGEQGFGDMIQFCRFCRTLLERGAVRVTLVCRPPLLSLLRVLEEDGRMRVTVATETVHLHDYWTFLLSIPLHLGVTLATLPAVLPYLRPPPLRDGLALPQGRGLRVGLVWRGSATHGNDGNRSLSGLAALRPLWAVSGVRFVGLQKGETALPPSDQPLLEMGSHLNDFADTAVVVAQLDLVISVDTALVHLCGALAKPCWVLVPWIGTDWRWLEDRSDSPWYPGVVRLFRQEVPGEWSEVIHRVVRELAAITSR
ncbi:MAG: tetratricopeptide repeat protein [Magnetococcales bacterium]|nr:tetratricopeptide repeat protein [Magnetococcales bacterium]